MDASDAQSTAENLTKILPSHPHSENINYVTSVETPPTEELPNLLETLISVFESEPFKPITDLEQQFSEFSEAVAELLNRLYSDKSQDSLLRNQSNEIVGFL
ncbi:hypothetical protein BY996DRAFT_6501361 [Phakopsora pachyrhizi]|nr:hypothetical protein BY996DRAFT_6501361 [Phakopsora pachyrhizi]